MSNPPATGIAIICRYLPLLAETPGVYRMLGKNGEALYVGKAKSLKQRVMAYTLPETLPLRLQQMVNATASMEFTHTVNEAEALLLEANLIKHHRPRYNILLKDDKSFPYITLSRDHPFPRIGKHRGARSKDTYYYGPYASAGDVNRAIAALQKSFLLRSCSDSFFKSRKRPCIEYQIKRCSAPCVGYINENDYAHWVELAHDFLSGKSQAVQQQLIQAMEKASSEQAYEKAAQLRDRIRALTSLQTTQYLHDSNLKDADVIAVYSEGNAAAITVFFIRGGQNLGNKTYFPENTEGASLKEMLEAFISRFYQTNPPPPLLLVNAPLNQALLEEALSALAAKTITLLYPKRGDKQRLMEAAASNAKEALLHQQKQEAGEQQWLEGVMRLFGLSHPPKRIEVYDNSHTLGSHAVGAMVVAGAKGLDKNAYRRFTVKPGSLTGGDDYAMLKEVLTRRFGRLRSEMASSPESRTIPDVVLIDGGVGHLTAATQVMANLGLSNIPLICISKGPDRNAGHEQFHMAGRKAFRLPLHDPVLHYLQRLRDEAHRFAITSHRTKHSKTMRHSILDSVPGIGTVRKKLLLHHFGSAAAIQQASVRDLSRVKGINATIAQRIYDYLHT